MTQPLTFLPILRAASCSGKRLKIGRLVQHGVLAIYHVEWQDGGQAPL